MKKLSFLFLILIICVEAKAQIVVNSQYKARSFDDMVAPFIMVQKFQEECLNSLVTLLDQLKQAEQFISEEKDPNTWNKYENCYNSIVDEHNSIVKNGTNQSTRNNISNLKMKSSSLLADIRAAYERRNRLSNDQYARLRAVDGLTCSRYFSDISIDEFMNGNTPTVTYQNR